MKPSVSFLITVFVALVGLGIGLVAYLTFTNGEGYAEVAPAPEVIEPQRVSLDPKNEWLRCPTTADGSGLFRVHAEWRVGYNGNLIEVRCVRGN